jgi:hypothetical protein
MNNLTKKVLILLVMVLVLCFAMSGLYKKKVSDGNNGNDTEQINESDTEQSSAQKEAENLQDLYMKLLNYRDEHALVPRADIYDYRDAISKDIDQSGLEDSVKIKLKEQLNYIAPGSDDGESILKESDNLIQLAHSLNAEVFYKHFDLLNVTLKARFERGGI